MYDFVTFTLIFNTCQDKDDQKSENVCLDCMDYWVYVSVISCKQKWIKFEFYCNSITQNSKSLINRFTPFNFDYSYI